MEELEKRIAAIEERNHRVESDKAWEMSFLRKILVSILTYGVISIFLWVNHFPAPLKNSIIPTTGFLLSTLSLSYFKNIWLKSRK